MSPAFLSTRRDPVFRRQTPYGMNRWTVCHGGMASFCAAVLTSELDPFSEPCSAEGPHRFMSWRDMGMWSAGQSQRAPWK